VPRRRCAAVVTAAGASTRMGGAAKKEFRSIGGVPVLALAIRPFLAAGFDRIVVTLPAGRLADAAMLLAPFLDVAALTLVEGGDTRQDSVRRGLLALAADPPDLVLIHDGARPWLAPALLTRVLESAERYGACVPVVEVTEAVKELEAGPGGGTAGTAAGPGVSPLVLRHLPRRHLRFAQTPQGFAYPRIVAAHESARAEGLSFVDDAEVFDRFAGPVAWVPGDPANRKITFPDDLEEAP
jgi:2-C-methyl-D-erythritol 4-phosphate cytidylyltransferase